MCGSSRRRFLSRAAVLGGAAVAGCPGLGSDPETRAGEHRDALARFRDVSTALSSGYRTSARYVREPAGVMATPFVNGSIERLDPERPQVLLYDLTDEGTYDLVGVKWFRPTSAVNSAPKLFGTRLRGPHEGRVASIPEHYGLTAWLFRDNPNGLFERFNPAIEPVELVSQVATVRRTLEPYLGGAGATSDWYTNTEKCIETDRGFYGIPFVDGRGETATVDRSRPPVLLYRVTPNWSYLLVGVEWHVPVTEADSPPSMFGFEFHEPRAPHAPTVEQGEHYGLHAWLFAANPRGMFEPFNSSLVC